MTTKNPSVSSQTHTHGQPSVQADRVMESFQKTMQAFLEVQKTTMLAYLNGRVSLPTTEDPELGNSSLNGTASPNTNGHAVARENGDSHGDISTRPLIARTSSRPPVGQPQRQGEYRKESVRQATSSQSNDTPAYQNGKTTSDVAVSQSSEKPIEAPSPAVGVAVPDRALITDRLLEIVRDRTGYPIETLGLDLDMEADLGIDSIKRVEILGRLRDDFPTLKSLSETPEVMDALARARTLGETVDRMSALSKPTNPTASPDPKPTLDPEPARAEVALDSVEKSRVVTLRRVLEAVDDPLPQHRPGLMRGGRIVVTEDRGGVAESLARRLESAGVRTERIGGANRPVEWTSPTAVDSVLNELRSEGPITGIVHALPLGQSTSGDPAGPCWTERIGDGVKGLFLLAKGIAPDLETAARGGGSCLIAGTMLGGRFSSVDSTHSDFFPGHGGVAGLVKTLAREWPTVRCRVVDFTKGEHTEALAAALADEVFVGDGWSEVGYERGRRIRIKTVERALRHGETSLDLNPGDPVVITGGARGITAIVASELARTWKPTLLILGTTPPPDQTETPETATLAGEAEIKTALLAQLRREGRAGSPAEIESSYQAIRRTREVRENLAILREAGAVVEYARADVRDPVAMASVLNRWRTQYGEPVGLIHGAGFIKDKLIREKSLESFDRVLGTKLEGALNILRLVRPESLKFTAMFSSIAGRFGNVGQSDYASANEILNKLAQWLDRRWPGRVVSVMWGPWSGVGMVSQLEGHLGRRGLGMISPELGRSLLVEELRYGRKGDVEILYTGGLGTLEEPLSYEPLLGAEAVR